MTTFEIVWATGILVLTADTALHFALRASANQRTLDQNAQTYDRLLTQYEALRDHQEHVYDDLVRLRRENARLRQQVLEGKQ